VSLRRRSRQTSHHSKGNDRRRRKWFDHMPSQQSRCICLEQRRY
jgi:hypothetical protein